MYKLTLLDNSIVASGNQEWRNISTEERVSYMEGTKTVFLCNLPVAKIKIQFNDLETEMEVPEGHKVYRAMRAGATFNNGVQKTEDFGQCVGLVKDGIVVEERVLNGFENIIQGWRK
jgi:hypothetical protein